MGPRKRSTAEAKDKLEVYRRKRSTDRTPEPVPDVAEPAAPATGTSGRFVIQEHHARALHWDFRLERDGVLVSWALPKGLPTDPKVNHLAVHTEDHPLEYLTFAGDIPAGEYGGGKVTIWDTGHYETQKWRDDEVMVVLHGTRSQGRFVLFRTGPAERSHAPRAGGAPSGGVGEPPDLRQPVGGGSRGEQWMIHRMDAPPRPDWQPMPELIRPMMATLADHPPFGDADWAFEMKWDGVRAVVYVDGGRARVMTRNDRDVRESYPELVEMAKAIGSTQVVLDGEIVALDESGRPDFGRLQQRMHVTSPSSVRTLAATYPVNYLIFDLLYADGTILIDRPYSERRAALEALSLQGPHWAVPPAFVGTGDAAMESSRALGLEGVVAKRRSSRYAPGKRTRDWIKVKHHRTQEVVICGWTPGEGNRAGRIGALLLGVPDEAGDLRFVGKVGTGFDDRTLRQLQSQLKPLVATTAPFATPVPRAIERTAHWVRPELVGEVAFSEWTSGEPRLRHPSWRGLRPDKSAADVVRED